MADNWRPIIGPDLAPFQQALATDEGDYQHYRMHQLMLGVVLEVYPSDSENNRSAQQSSDRRGYVHEAKVLLVGTNASANLVVDHVLITSPMVTGLDNYYEHLPRGSTNRVDGERLNNNGANVDPYDLDGDWCVVGFVGGSLDQPFILTWWPHPRNNLDPLTSGNGNPSRSGEGQALDQQGRHFHRINGVEWIITKKGDVYLSTNFSNSTLRYSDGQEPTKGRWRRDTVEDEGGSILVEIKPSQTLEMSWEAPIEGAGIRRGNEAELPQSNPKKRTGNAGTSERENTYIKVDNESIALDGPSEVKLSTRTRIRLNSDDEAVISATNVLTLDSVSIKLGDGAEATQGVVRGSDLHLWLSTMTVLTATGPASINMVDLDRFISDTVSTKTTVE